MGRWDITGEKKMNKIVISFLTFAFLATLCPIKLKASNSVLPSCNLVINKEIGSASGVVFRSLQKLRSDEGEEIYLYSSGKCEIYNGDGVLTNSIRYTIQGDELMLLDEDGDTIMKGRIYWDQHHINAQRVVLMGITFYKRS